MLIHYENVFVDNESKTMFIYILYILLDSKPKKNLCVKDKSVLNPMVIQSLG